jgi:hypothetical protein
LTVPLARILVDIAALYFGLGLLAAIWIAFRGLGRLDPVAAHGTPGFRLLILPGLTALWPLMLIRCIRGRGEPPVERTAHRVSARSTGSPQ